MAAKFDKVISIYPWELVNGGEGVELAATTTSQAVALPGGEGTRLLVICEGPESLWFAIGVEGVECEVGMRVPPGEDRVFDMPDGTNYTHIAFKTRAGTSYGVCYRGSGS